MNRNTNLNRFDKIGEYPGATSPSINSEGNIISVTEVKDEGNNTSSSIVKIFERENNYINNAISQMNGWKQLGPDISIASPNSFGNKTDLDSSGKIICISDENYRNQNQKGNVYVYKLSDNNDSWVQVGNTIEGLQQEHLGYDINLNSDGTILAVLSYYLYHFNYSYQHPNRSLLNDTEKFFKNEIKIYEKHTTSTGTVEWKLLGEPIRSIKNNDNGLNDFRPLTYLSMSKDGKILACNIGIYTIKTSKIMNNLVAPNINVSNNISTKNVIFNQVEDNLFPTNLIIRDRYNLKIQEFTKKDIIDFINDKNLVKYFSIFENQYEIANKIIISDNFAVLLLQSTSRSAQENFIVIFEKMHEMEVKMHLATLKKLMIFFLTEKDSDSNFYGSIQVYFKAGATAANTQNTTITTSLKFIEYNSFENKWRKIDSNTNNELELTGLQVFNKSKNFATRSNFIQCEKYKSFWKNI